MTEFLLIFIGKNFLILTTFKNIYTLEAIFKCQQNNQISTKVEFMKLLKLSKILIFLKPIVWTLIFWPFLPVSEFDKTRNFHYLKLLSFWTVKMAKIAKRPNAEIAIFLLIYFLKLPKLAKLAKHGWNCQNHQNCQKGQNSPKEI